MIKVSIIVPIYNAGHRLRECLETLVNQTLREIEIICVLDCPTDGSDEIAEEYAARDNRIKLIYNETNLHVAESRNVGIGLAHGEYIGFSDHDDSRILEMYEKLYKSAKANNSEIVVSNSFVADNNKIIKYSYGDPSKSGIIKSIILPMDHPNNKNYLSKSVWATIYSREFILKNQILFPDRSIYYEEDTLFNLNAFLIAKSISYCSNALYCWNKINESQSNTIITHEENVNRQIFFIDQIEKYLIKYDSMRSYRSELVILISVLIKTYLPYYNCLPKVKKRLLCNLLNNCRYPIFKRYFGLKLISKKRIKLYYFVLKLKLLQ